eukprot:TRINITY_DN25894_c0_g1_i1.p1 TRINITY_DN25894_c0_g1~~TRINITY_DN25894_c0_g1_i1.p1  ORF type:complete len:415 (+),score=144.86 TRINITY_DN25894_c0_g1_i1:163-1407(+)
MHRGPSQSGGGVMFQMCIQESFPDELLLQASGMADLRLVSQIELAFDAEEVSAGELGRKLPNLAMLRASGSNVPSLRDLGGHMRNLSVLWLNHSGVQSCAGVSSLPQLRELYVAFNRVEEVSWLAGHEKLRVLDLEANCVASVGQVELLAGCPSLASLTLDGNPVTAAAGFADLLKVMPALEATAEAAPSSTSPPLRASPPPPQLKECGWRDGVEGILEGMRREVQSRELAETAGVTDAMRQAREMRLVSESIRRGAAADCAAMLGRPASAAAARPGTAVRRPSARAGYGRRRPASAAGHRRPPPAAALSPPPAAATEASASALTYRSASVICGNPTKSLRTRRLDEAAAGDTPVVQASGLALRLEEEGDEAILDSVAEAREAYAEDDDDGRSSMSSDLGGCEILRLSDDDEES